MFTRRKTSCTQSRHRQILSLLTIVPCKLVGVISWLASIISLSLARLVTLAPQRHYSCKLFPKLSLNLNSCPKSLNNQQLMNLIKTERKSSKSIPQMEQFKCFSLRISMFLTSSNPVQFKSPSFRASTLIPNC